MPSLIFRKGLDLKHAVAGMLAENYHSAIVERIKAEDFTYRVGRLTMRSCRIWRSRSNGPIPSSCRRSTRSRRTSGRFAISADASPSFRCSRFKVQGSRFVQVLGAWFNVHGSGFASAAGCRNPERRTPNVEHRTPEPRTRTNLEP